MQNFQQKNKIIAFLFVLIFLAVIVYQVRKDNAFQKALSQNQTTLTAMQKQLQTLSASEGSDSESIRRLALASESKQGQLTDTVAKATPAVVSIVISENVPQYSVSYVNPFGDDPMFQGFGVQVPVYTQNGSSEQTVGAGSGFIISSDGYILTNKHVVSDSNAQYTVLLASGAQKTATVVYRDPNNDMAIVKISGSGYPTIPLGDSGLLSAGQSVVAIGNALGQFQNTVSVGVISGLNRTIQATDQMTGQEETLSGIIQTDAAINPGNSGGPLLDLNGEAIGINVATAEGGNSIGFALPINSLKSAISANIK